MIRILSRTEQRAALSMSMISAQCIATLMMDECSGSYPARTALVESKSTIVEERENSGMPGTGYA